MAQAYYQLLGYAQRNIVPESKESADKAKGKGSIEEFINRVNFGG